jgi:hypothetical protein
MRRRLIGWALVVLLLVGGLGLGSVRMPVAYADSDESPKCIREC